jgi:hypothetical protein
MNTFTAYYAVVQPPFRALLPWHLHSPRLSLPHQQSAKQAKIAAALWQFLEVF